MDLQILTADGGSGSGAPSSGLDQFGAAKAKLDELFMEGIKNILAHTATPLGPHTPVHDTLQQLLVVAARHNCDSQLFAG